DDASGRPRNEAQDRERGHALAAARLAHDAQGLAGGDGERDAIDGADHAVVRIEVGLEVFDAKEIVARHHASLAPSTLRGSSPSPKKLNASTVRNIAMPGANSSHGNEVSVRSVRACWSMLPHEGEGSCTPAPRKESTTSPRM